MYLSPSHLKFTSRCPPQGIAPENQVVCNSSPKPRHEKWIVGQLQEKKVFTFLPLLQQIRQWSDRRIKVEVPMFSCYAFVRIVQTTGGALKGSTGRRAFPDS